MSENCNFLSSVVRHW